MSEHAPPNAPTRQPAEADPPRALLYRIAHARSGDKGDTVNVGVIARRPEFYEVLRERLTTEAVAAHFGALVKGGVERFELPNLNALNFLLHGALDGGGTMSLMTDAQGKTFSTALLRMRIELPAELHALIPDASSPAGSGPSSARQDGGR